MSWHPKTWLVVAIAFLLALALSTITYRDGRRLTFDGYHYCELAKEFTDTWPDRFGNHWPFGYPLAGALLARGGVPAYEALVLVSCGNLILLLAWATHILGAQSLRLPIVGALAAAPIVSVQLLGILTELPLAAFFLGLIVCLAHWPARSALWGAAACTVAALAMRYAGIIAVAALLSWLLWRWRPLREAGRLRDALAATALALLATSALLALNIARSGHASGAGRGNPPGLSALPQELADFGWSAPSALIAGGVRDRIGPGTALGLAIGSLLFAAMALLCLQAWVRPRSAFSRPLALVTLGYAVGMGVLHCIGEFDALHSARTFLPILFPCGLLTVESLGGLRRGIVLGSGALLLAGLTAAARGLSPEIAGEVRPAVTLLRALVRPGDIIAINDHAFPVSAYLPQRTIRVWPATWLPDRTERFFVIAGQPRGRSGHTNAVTADWTARLESAVTTGGFRYIVNSRSLVAVERRAAPTPR